MISTRGNDPYIMQMYSAALDIMDRNCILGIADRAKAETAAANARADKAEAETAAAKAETAAANAEISATKAKLQSVLEKARSLGINLDDV